MHLLLEHLYAETVISPGMMTGQILGGSPVTEAAHYQILIMYLIATCTFCITFINVYVTYRVAFEGHVLRTDKFIKADRMVGLGIMVIFQVCYYGVKSGLSCCGLFRRRNDIEEVSENHPLINDVESKYGTTSTNGIQILTRQVTVDARTTNTPFFRASKIQFSVPCSDQLQQQRVLCSNLNVSLNRGEIGIVRGPSGSGKTVLLRALAGLTPLDCGDCTLSKASLGDCFRQNTGGYYAMLQWRGSVRYVTQYKVDLPGSPRDFIQRMSSFGMGTPSNDDMIFEATTYLQQWGMGTGNRTIGNRTTNLDGQNSYLDKEWKQLSGGESQRCELIGFVQ